MDNSATPASQITRRRKPKWKNSTGETLDKVLHSVRMRMYRQGLGDCFLLTFTNADQKQYNLLIDCGVLPFSHAGDQRLDLIAQNILTETGRHLDTVVATHEHADHISGFKSAAEFFGLNPEKKPAQPVQVDHVWLAWTENKDDEQVKKITARMNSLALAVTATVQAMDTTQGQSIRDILLFGGAAFDSDSGPGGTQATPGEQNVSENAVASKPQQAETSQDTNRNPESLGLTKFKLNQSMAQIMDWLRGWGPVDFLEPDNVRELPEFGIKFYILGPSRRMSMLGGSGPLGQTPGPGMASHELKLNQSNAFMAAAVRFAGMELDEAPGDGLSKSDVDTLYRLSLPFDPTRFLTIEEAQKPYPLPENPKYPDKLQAAYRDFFKEVYGFGDKITGYGPEWRRIDTEWLQTGETLALQQVSTVNNTSLVLAIEIVQSGQVLLFVGDAEQESWQTWENKNANLDTLLANTVLYKVGHHGSINGTDQELFKNKLTNPDLVALLPVDMKRATDKNWEFPAASLYNTDSSITDDTKKGLLFTQTHGHIILNCDQECMNCDPSFDENKPWPGKISKDGTPEKLWVEYTLTF